MARRTNGSHSDHRFNLTTIHAYGRPEAGNRMLCSIARYCCELFFHSSLGTDKLNCRNCLPLFATKITRVWLLALSRCEGSSSTTARPFHFSPERSKACPVDLPPTAT